jgi:hypothetical protein
MKWSGQTIWFAGALLVALGFGPGEGQAQTNRTAARGTPIIFSAPESELTASNLHDLPAPASPFRNLESSLKRPFDVFEGSAFGPSSAAPQGKLKVPPQLQQRPKSAKQLRSERAEQMFLEPELYQGETEDDLFGLSADLDPQKRKPKTTLDRYYDRLDRLATNRFAPPNPSALELEPVPFEDSLNRRNFNAFSDPTPDSSRRDAAQSYSSNPFSVRTESDPTSPSTLREDAGRAANVGSALESPFARRDESWADFRGFRAQRESRLDSFKRLLESPHPASPGAVNAGINPLTPSTPARSASLAGSSTPGLAQSAASATPTPVFTPSYSSYRSFTETSARPAVPALPSAVPDYSPNAAVPPKPLVTPRPPKSEFKVPARNF